MAPRVLLTGATGFIGREVARALSEDTRELSSLVRGPEPEARLERAGVPGRACPGDLEDPRAVRAAVAGVDVVVHAAAVVNPALQRDAAAVLRINRDATVQLAKIAESEGVRRFVFMSSIAAMGFWSGRASGDSACRPETPYGRAKREAELAVLALGRPGFDVVVLRPPTVYGPGESYNFLAWVHAVDIGFFRIIGSGKNRFPLATVTNVARVTRAAAAFALAPGVYVVGDREPYTIARIHEAILAALGRGRVRLRIPSAAAVLAGFANERLAHVWPRVPLVLTRARVRTLTVDQHFDVSSLLAAGIELDAPLTACVERTIRDYERRGLLRRARVTP